MRLYTPPNRALQTTNALRENLQQIEEGNLALKERMGRTQRKVLTAFTRDSRKSKRWAKMQEALSDLVWAGLQSIPFYGGFFALAYKVLKDPIKGLHNVARTSYGTGSMNGSAWNLFGSSANGVMSPLGPGDENFNYANGRVSAFNGSTRLRMEQLESDISDMVNTGALYKVNYGEDMSASSSDVKFKIEQENMNLVYTGWRKQVLSKLAEKPEDDWIWYTMAKCVASMRGKHQGKDDLEYGVFKMVGDHGGPRLANSQDMEAGIDKTYKKSSHYSNMHIVLSNYTRPHYNPGFQWNDRHNVQHDLLDAETIYRVECEKALIVAYQSEVRNTLAEKYSHHLFEIIRDNVSSIDREAETQRLRETMSQDKNINMAAIGITAPFRLMGVVLPKVIYNCNTTFESKKYARYLCAVSIFYSILEAYFDKQFVCDELPSQRSYLFFLWAFGDAYNTAMEYFCHTYSVSENTYRSNAAELLHNTLQTLLQTDPAIDTYLTSVLPFNSGDKNLNAVPPGLQGFKHLKASQRVEGDLIGKYGADCYSENNSKSLLFWNGIIGQIQEARRNQIALQNAPAIPPGLGLGGAGQAPGQALGQAPGQAANAALGNAGGAVRVEGTYMQTLSTAMNCVSLPAEVQQHFLSIHNMLRKLRAI